MTHGLLYGYGPVGPPEEDGDKPHGGEPWRSGTVERTSRIERAAFFVLLFAFFVFVLWIGLTYDDGAANDYRVTGK